MIGSRLCKYNEFSELRCISSFNSYNYLDIHDKILLVWKGVEKMDNSYVMRWGTLALINAGIAQGKNRTGLNWFLLSLVLGPVATFILLFVEKR